MPFKPLALAVLFIATILGQSNAAVLDATPVVMPDYSSFQIVFDDLNGDRLFTGLSEMTSFSGVTIWTNFRSSIYNMATIGGITSNCPGGCSGTWIFGTESEGIFVTNASNWTYTLQGLTAVLPGDYNGDGKVNAADYVVWRKNGTNPLPNDNGLTTAAARYDLWRANFGGTAGGGSASGVPEPAALVMLTAAAFVNRLRRRASV